MLYRESGQFKATYAADQQIFPIRQDRYAMLLLLTLAFCEVPFVSSQYMFSAMLRCVNGR